MMPIDTAHCLFKPVSMTILGVKGVRNIITTRSE